jgi:hypothetical protein
MPARSSPSTPSLIAAPSPGADDHGVELPLQIRQRIPLQPAVAVRLDTELHDARQVALQYLIRQAVGGNAVAQHAAERRAGLVDGHRMPRQRKLPGGSKPGRAAADHRKAATQVGGLRSRLMCGMVADPAFQAADIHRAVENQSIAGCHAGRRTDPAAHGRQRLGAQQDRSGRVGAIPPQGLDETDHVVPRRTGEVAGCGLLTIKRRLVAPGAGLEVGREVLAMLADGGDRRRYRGPDRGSRLRTGNRVPHLHPLKGVFCRRQVLAQAQRRKSLVERGQRHAEQARVGADHGGVDDDDGTAADAVFARDRGGIDHAEAEVAVLTRIAVETAMGVEQQHPARHRAGQNQRAHQPFVEHDQVVGAVDLVVVVDRQAVDAGIGLDRRTGAFAAVVAEGLHLHAHPGIEQGDQFGAGDAALAAAAMDTHFEGQGKACG